MLKIPQTTFLLLMIASALFLMTGCRRDEDTSVQAANNRIEQAIGGIEVRAGGTNSTLGDFRESSDRGFSEISVNMDFNRILENVEEEDFLTARRQLPRHIDNLYSDLALMFALTDNLIIRERNVSSLADFEIPAEVRNMREFPIEVSRFITSPDKFMRIDTHYGSLDIYSDFFYERTGFGDTDLELLFWYEEDEVVGNTIVGLSLRDSAGNDRGPQLPGRSATLAIPLESDFMRGPNNEILYNAVVFIDSDDVERGVLPRSFIDGNNLYFYTNRTGRFRLTGTPNGDTRNMADFLNDRGISVSGIQHEEQRVVTRGEFYSALMHIHWVEDLHFDTEGIRSFPDVPAGGRLERDINIGQSLGAFPLTGRPSGFFYPNAPLLRSEMFIILAGYIEAFSIEVDGLRPIVPGTLGMPEDTGGYWYNALHYLIDRRFVPYRTNAYGEADYAVYDIAAREPVTVEEAQEVLFSLITTRHLNE